VAVEGHLKEMLGYVGRAESSNGVPRQKAFAALEGVLATVQSDPSRQGDIGTQWGEARDLVSEVFRDDSVPGDTRSHVIDLSNRVDRTLRMGEAAQAK
jgi:hypothetical protein